MSKRYILTVNGLDRAIKPLALPMARFGIDVTGLLHYALNPDLIYDREQMRAFVLKDLAELNPVLIEDLPHMRQMTDACVDLVNTASQLMITQIESTLGIECDHLVRLDQYLGSNDVMISVGRQVSIKAHSGYETHFRTSSV